MKFFASLFALFFIASFAFAGVTEMRIWCDEMMDEDPGNPGTRYGQSSVPATYYVVRWAINHKETRYMKITSDDPVPAAGPYCMDVLMDDIPGPNLWMDMRRADAAVGWEQPLDASATERVTFWIKAEPGTAPVWFYALDYDNAWGKKDHSASIRIEGETIIAQDEFGEFFAHRLNTFDGTWQFVSLPWAFLMETDSSIVDAVVPYSFVMEGTSGDTDGENSSFGTSNLRTLTWPTITTDDGPHAKWDDVYRTSPDCKWDPDPSQKLGAQRWTFDEVIFCLNDGTGVTDVDGNPTVVPLEYTMSNNYPNPFNPTTEIEYGIPISNRVTITIFNSLGQHVRTLVDRDMTAGTYHATWDGRDDMGNMMPSGMYFYKMNASHFNSVKKMLLMK
ncbi:T9SS type A sorting domain-containing protein [candidate division KSB1 bacterium]|nr:T9SS type A sorting domain-containing protein [candidate division KSB1 bacterium]